MSQLTKIRILEEIADAYRSLYPAKYEAARRMVRQAREQILPGKFSSGGSMQWLVRVPTEVFLFIRRYIPDFGEDYRDWQLLATVWSDLKVT